MGDAWGATGRAATDPPRCRRADPPLACCPAGCLARRRRLWDTTASASTCGSRHSSRCACSWCGGATQRPSPPCLALQTLHPPALALAPAAEQAFIDVKYAAKGPGATELKQPFADAFEAGFFQDKAQFDAALQVGEQVWGGRAGAGSVQRLESTDIGMGLMGLICRLAWPASAGGGGH